MHVGGEQAQTPAIPADQRDPVSTLGTEHINRSRGIEIEADGITIRVGRGAKVARGSNSRTRELRGRDPIR
jgi:hypothetical protein